MSHDLTQSNAIVVTDLRKRFGNFEALRGVSLTVPLGGIFGLIGPNGAGKTTLFSTMLGYLKPTSGSVRILGVEPRRLHTLQGAVAALPQDSQLPPTVSVGQAMRFFARLAGCKDVEADIKNALEFVDLTKWQDAKMRQLSHGMQKRVGIAQAILGWPQVIVLDEPTAGLDPKNAFELGKLFQRMAERSTVVISSHNLTELEHLCHNAAIIVKGEVVRQGSMDDIRRTDQEVHIVLASGAPNEAALREKLPNVTLAWSVETSRLTLRFPSDGSNKSDEVTTQALSALISQGALVRTVERGQSLLKTYLELSKS